MASLLDLENGGPRELLNMKLHLFAFLRVLFKKESGGRFHEYIYLAFVYNMYIYKMHSSVIERFFFGHIIVFSFIFIYAFDLYCSMFSTWSSEIMYNGNRF